MTHYLMLRFFSGTFDETLYETLYHLFRYAVPQECPEIREVKVMRNMVSRQGNYDLIVSFHLPGAAALDAYLICDAHREIVRLTNPIVESRASIDVKSF